MTFRRTVNQTRSFRSDRSTKEVEELRERVDDRGIEELEPFAQRPMLQKTESNASHKSPRILAARNINTTWKIADFS